MQKRPELKQDEGGWPNGKYCCGENASWAGSRPVHHPQLRMIYGSFWALLGDPLNAPCSSSTGEPGGGSTVTLTPTPPSGKALAGSERSGGPGTQHRGQQDITAQLALTSLRKEQLYWSTGHITYNPPLTVQSSAAFTWQLS